MAKGERTAAKPAVEEGVAEAVPARVKKPVEKRFVIQSKQIDKLNVRRTRVELTPAVCQHSGFDACKSAGVPPYAELPAEIQLRVVALVEEHKQKVHTKSESKVLRESEMPTEYLGLDG